MPQNRERVFIIGHLGERGGREIFPIQKGTTTTLGEKTFYVTSESKQFYSRRRGVIPCLLSSKGRDYLIEENNRFLTPKEWFRTQGFPDEYFERATRVNSNSQLYKQAGNSVTVNVIYEIAKRLKEV